MKKFLSILLAAAMLLTLASVALADDPVTITFVGIKGEVQDVMKEIIADFEAENPGIHVEYSFNPDGASGLASMISSGNTPDLLNVYPLEAQYRAYYDEGYIVDVTDYCGNIEQTLLDLCEYNGVQIGVPFTLSTYGVYYNKKIYADLGLEVPTTIEGLIANAKACKEAGYDGFTLPMGGSQNQITERLLGALDGETHVKFAQVAAGELDIHDVPSLNAYADLMLALMPLSTEDALGLNYDGATADFVTGKAAMRFDGSWFLATALKANPDFEIGYFAIPSAVSETPIVPVNVDTTVGMSATTKYPEEAAKFLAYLTTTDAENKYYAVDGNINMTKGVVYDKTQLMDVYNAVMAGNMSITQINQWGKNGVLIRQDLGSAAQGLFGDQDKEAFFEACAAVIEDDWE